MVQRAEQKLLIKGRGPNFMLHVLYWGYIGIMEKNMETTIVYWGYMEALQSSSFLGFGMVSWLGFLLGLPKRYYIGGSRCWPFSLVLWYSQVSGHEAACCPSLDP